MQHTTYLTHIDVTPSMSMQQPEETTLLLAIPESPKEGYLAEFFQLYEPGPRQCLYTGKKVTLVYHPWKSEGWLRGLYVGKNGWQYFGWRAMEHPEKLQELFIAVRTEHIVEEKCTKMGHGLRECFIFIYKQIKAKRT